MEPDKLDTEQYEADFAASGVLEFDELDEAESDYELEQLTARVYVARSRDA